MTKQTKKGAPACGLYLRIADDIPLEKAFADLREAAFVINRSAYEKNMHVVEVGADPADAESLQRLEGLVQGARQNGLVVVVRQHAGLVFAAQADGVLLDKPDDVEKARQVLGEEAIVGLRCGLSRATAEAALSQAVDYVSFYAAANSILPPESLIGWWGVKSDVPCLVEGKLTNNDCGRYVRAGATFLEGSDYIWNHPQGIKQATIDMLYAIDLATESKTIQ